MKLLLIRHGDPDYELDSLTPRGMKEAELLAQRLADVSIKEIYVSPKGRAQKTAEFTLRKKQMTAETLPWLREFSYPIEMPQEAREPNSYILWNLRPTFCQSVPQLYDPEKWLQVDFIKNSVIPEKYKMVCDSLDELLAKHGYVRDGMFYRVEQGNTDTIAIFCHFALTSILLSHLLNMAPMPLLQQFGCAPSSVTTVVTEECQQGTAQFRCTCYGSTEHLHVGNTAPSSSGLYEEIFKTL